MEIHRKVSEDFVSACILNATVEHNGYQGGDAGHGGFVEITLEDQGGTCMSVNGKEMEKIVLVFRGDCERDVLLASLKFIVDELENNSRSRFDPYQAEKGQAKIDL